MRYAKIKPLDVSNGNGIKTSIFVTGCEHYCEDCFNSEIWSFDTGELFTDEVKEEFLSNLDKSYVSGISILGGEPLHPRNYFDVINLVNECKRRYPKKEVWIWTGYRFEELLRMYSVFNNWKCIDYIVDGKFVKGLRDSNLKYKGSKNQRVIDMKKTLSVNRMSTKMEDIRIITID